MSAAVFVGPELCADPEWQDITTTYATNMFPATRAASKCVLDKRAAEKQKEPAEGREPEKHEDTLSWLEERAKFKPYDAIATQLGFAMAGLHNTTQLHKQAMLDICGQPELVDPLREDIEVAVKESGWTTAGLYKMQLMGS
ncbi:hypothetical protein SLS58_011241 [Diplodia intermedia]|uniref:Uncharacterized protein n=1 Tax=Diplodia intermedia TaxID=856260 RepID=A0ABR3T0B5_9PEZI